MVIFRFFFLCLLTITCHLKAVDPLDVTVSASIDTDKTFENAPVQGTITVTHPKEKNIDETSFTIDGKKISVEAVKTMTISKDSPLQISIYRFSLPGRSEGLYVLPAVHVRVGEKDYHSISNTYEVTGAKIDSKAPKPSLKLETAFVGRIPLYPGEQALIVYRFLFQGSIELTEEFLPLLSAKGFAKVGGRQVKEYVEGGWHVQEISQKIQAKTPGDYTFAPSKIEGYGYIEDFAKRRTFLKPKLFAESPSIKITVAPFPEKDRPPFFYGALGSFYKIEAFLITPSTVSVEDEMELAVAISGDGDIESIPAPVLRSQESFSSSFRLSDLPPTAEIKEQEKIFVFELRPLAAGIKQIPGISFSYFNPKDSTYQTIASNPIPITVLPSSQDLTKQKNLPLTSKAIEDKEKEFKEFLKPSAQEIAAIKDFSAKELAIPFFKTWAALWIVPFGALLLGLQLLLKLFFSIWRKRHPKRLSALLFKKSLTHFNQPKLFYPLLEEAFLQALKEKGVLQASDLSPDLIPEEGVSGDVKRFLSSIEEKRFTGKIPNSKQVRKDAKILFSKL